MIDIEQESISIEQLKQLITAAYPAASTQLATCFFAKNQAYAGDQDIVTAADEIALIPPVSGGQPSKYEITHDTIDVS